MEIKDVLFHEAITTIDSGDIHHLEQLLRDHPRLLNDRVKYGTEGYFKDPYLLWFIAGNPVRQEKLPDNIIDITRSIIQAAERIKVENLQYQIDYTLSLVCSGRIPRECGAQKKLIQLLIEKGADPTGALLPAIAQCEVDAVRWLLEFGATLTLAAAISLKKTEDIKRLIQFVSSQERQLGLAVAAFYGQAETLALLINSGVDVNVYNLEPFHSHAMPLHQAVFSGSLDAVKILIDAGANLNARDKIYNGLPLGWAIYGNANQEIADYLRSRMAMEIAEKLMNAGLIEKNNLEKATAILIGEIQV